MKLPDHKIKEIVEFLKMGMLGYIHKTTKEVVFLLDVGAEEFYNYTGETQEGYAEINENKDDYYYITKMSSRRAFEIMENFANYVPDYSLKGKLFQSLSQRSPFRKFKTALNYEESYLKQWYEFEKNAYVDYVKFKLENIEDSYDPN